MQAVPAGAGADMRQEPTRVTHRVAVPAGPELQPQTRRASHTGSPRCWYDWMHCGVQVVSAAAGSAIAQRIRIARSARIAQHAGSKEGMTSRSPLRNV